MGDSTDQAQVQIQGAAPAVNPDRRRKESMRGYTVKYVNPNTSDPTMDAPTFGHTKCTIYSGDQDASGYSHRLAFQMNLEAGQAVLATSKEARAAHFIGCITNVFPSRKDEFLKLAGDGGYRFTIVRVPSGLDNVTHVAPANGIHPPSKACAIFGYLVLTLFKQIDEESYQPYTDKTMKALFKVAAYEVAEDEDQTVFNDMAHAKTYRITFGQNFGLRKRITECVIEENKRDLTSPLGGVCSYVCCILSWNEMTTLNSIMETLLITRSPLLTVPELGAEILNVEKALRAVRNSNTPQFFRILHPPHETQVMMRANFPKLAAIAAKLKGNTESNANRNVDSGKLEEWVNIHKNAMLGQVGQQTFFQGVDYLTHDFSRADED